MLQLTKMYISYFLFWNHVIYQHTLCFTYWWVFYSSPNKSISFFANLISFLVFSRPKKNNSFLNFSFFLFLIILEFFTLLVFSCYSPKNKLYFFNPNISHECFFLGFCNLRSIVPISSQLPDPCLNFLVQTILITFFHA